MKFDNNISSYSYAKSRFEDFIAGKILKYGQMRNFDFGDIQKNFVTGLSPSINRRIISEQQIVTELLQNYKYTDVKKFIEQLCWRTYWKGYLEHYEGIWDSYIEDLKVIEKNIDYLNAINAKTGIKCFDHWVEELIDTGHLQNHSRMWFASIWVFTLGLPWQLGASFFMQYLLDADCASNTLSWRWVSGLHTKGKTYLAASANIKKYTGQRFHPVGQLAKTAKTFKTEEFIRTFAHSNKLDKANNIRCYLIHENDLSHKTIPNCEILFIQKNCMNNIVRSSMVKRFINGALQNLQNIVREKSSAETILFSFEELAKMKSICERNKILNIYTSYPTVGPVKKELECLFKTLGVDGTYLISSWDQHFWPHAHKGYFKLKKEIPRILDILENKINA